MLASDIKESENNSGQEIRTGSGELNATSVKFDYSREDYLKKKDRIFEILQKMKKSNDGESPDEEISTENGSHQRRAPKNYSNDIRLEPTWKTNKNPQLSSQGSWFQKYTSNDSKSDSGTNNGSSISSTVSLVTKRGNEPILSSTSSSSESKLCSTTASESLSPCYSGNATSSTVVDCSIDSLQLKKQTGDSPHAKASAYADKIFPGEAEILAIRHELFGNEWHYLTKLDTLPPTSELPDEKILIEDSVADSVHSNSDANPNALISSSDADPDPLMVYSDALPLALESGTLIEYLPSPIEVYSSKGDSSENSKSRLVKGSSISLPDLRRKSNPKLKISASFTSSGYSSFHSNCSFLKEKEPMLNLQGVSSKKCAIKHLSNEIKNGGSSGSNQSPNNCTEKGDTVEMDNSTEVADTHDEVMIVHEEEETKEKRKGRKKKRQTFKKKLSSLWKFLTCGVGHSRSH